MSNTRNWDTEDLKFFFSCTCYSVPEIFDLLNKCSDLYGKPSTLAEFRNLLEDADSIRLSYAVEGKGEDEYRPCTLYLEAVEDEEEGEVLYSAQIELE